jgi:hypothetical protein
MTCVVLRPGAFAHRAFAGEAFATTSDDWARPDNGDAVWVVDPVATEIWVVDPPPASVWVVDNASSV